MNDFLSEISRCPLFNGIAPDELGRVLACISTQKRSYKKGDIIVRVGDKIDFVVWIINGTVSVTYENSDGHITILESASAPDMFLNAFDYIQYSPALAVAAVDCELLFIKVITPCSPMCSFHAQMLKNLLYGVSKASVKLLNKVIIFTQPTHRQKVLSFLNMISEQNGKAKKFTVPYNREEMAQYLNVNQSALSKELRKMSEDGVIRFWRNEFELL